MENTIITSENEQALRDLILNDYPEAVRSGNPENYAVLLTEDVTWIPPGSPTCHGKQEVKASQESLFAMFYCDPTISIEELHIFDSETDAYIIGNVSLTFTPKNGAEPTKLNLRPIWILRKEKGQWKVAKLLWNSPDIIDFEKIFQSAS